MYTTYTVVHGSPSKIHQNLLYRVTREYTGVYSRVRSYSVVSIICVFYRREYTDTSTPVYPRVKTSISHSKNVCACCVAPHRCCRFSQLLAISRCMVVTYSHCILHVANSQHKPAICSCHYIQFSSRHAGNMNQTIPPHAHMVHLSKSNTGTSNQSANSTLQPILSSCGICLTPEDSVRPNIRQHTTNPANTVLKANNYPRRCN